MDIRTRRQGYMESPAPLGALPVILIVAIVVAVAGLTTVAWLNWSDTVIENIVDAATSYDSAFFGIDRDNGNLEKMRQAYKESYPHHSEQQFLGYLDYFIQGVVCMRFHGELTYNEYANPTENTYQKIWNTYIANDPMPEYKAIKAAFDYIIKECWNREGGEGQRLLVKAENLGIMDTLKQAWQDAKAAQERMKIDPDFRNEFTEEWRQENAEIGAAAAKLQEKMSSALPDFVNVGNIALIGGIVVCGGMLLFLGSRVIKHNKAAVQRRIEQAEKQAFTVVT